MSAENPAELAARLATMRRLKRRVELLARSRPAYSTSSPAPAGPGSVAELVARAADELERRQRERAQAELEAATAGGPCVWCGVQYSRVRRRDGRVVGRWYGDNNGPACAWCWRDRRGFTAALGDREWRHRAAVQVLGPASRSWVAPFLAERVGWRWWYETGAQPGGRRRWAYVDRPAMLAALAPDKPAYLTGDTCRCGRSDRWLRTAGGGPPAYVDGRLVVLGPGLVCGQCGHRRPDRLALAGAG